nr:hypothetical protein [uncultured Mediterranean phage uvMED]
MTLDMDSIYERMDLIEKHEFPFALSAAMTRCMFLISNKYLRHDIDKYVAGGATKWSKSGILYQKASKENLYAAVYYKDDRFYLGTITFGGTTVPHTGNKVLIEPVNQKVNKFGNIPRRSLANKAAKKHLYFVGKPGNRPYGLYRRYKKKAPDLVIMLQNQSREQKSIFPAPARAARVFNRLFNDVFYNSMNRALQTSRYQNPTGF